MSVAQEPSLALSSRRPWVFVLSFAMVSTGVLLLGPPVVTTAMHCPFFDGWLQVRHGVLCVEVAVVETEVEPREHHCLGGRPDAVHFSARFEAASHWRAAFTWSSGDRDQGGTGDSVRRQAAAASEPPAC